MDLVPFKLSSRQAICRRRGAGSASTSLSELQKDGVSRCGDESCTRSECELWCACIVAEMLFPIFLSIPFDMELRDSTQYIFYSPSVPPPRMIHLTDHFNSPTLISIFRILEPKYYWLPSRATMPSTTCIAGRIVLILVCVCSTLHFI